MFTTYALLALHNRHDSRRRSRTGKSKLYVVARCRLVLLMLSILSCSQPACSQPAVLVLCPSSGRHCYHVVCVLLRLLLAHDSLAHSQLDPYLPQNMGSSSQLSSIALGGWVGYNAIHGSPCTYVYSHSRSYQPGCWGTIPLLGRAKECRDLKPHESMTTLTHRNNKQSPEVPSSPTSLRSHCRHDVDIAKVASVLALK